MLRETEIGINTEVRDTILRFEGADTSEFALGIANLHSEAVDCIRRQCVLRNRHSAARQNEMECFTVEYRRERTSQ